VGTVRQDGIRRVRFDKPFLVDVLEIIPGAGLGGNTTCSLSMEMV